MIVVQLVGAAALARLMAADARETPDLSWLLFGPSDPSVVAGDAEAPPLLLAAE